MKIKTPKPYQDFWPIIFLVLALTMACIAFATKKVKADQLYVVTCYAGSTVIYHEFATIEQYENGFFQVDNGREKIKLNLHCMIRNK